MIKTVTLNLTLALMRSIVVLQKWAELGPEIYDLGLANCSASKWAFIALIAAYTANTLREVRHDFSVIVDMIRAEAETREEEIAETEDKIDTPDDT